MADMALICNETIKEESAKLAEKELSKRTLNLQDQNNSLNAFAKKLINEKVGLQQELSRSKTEIDEIKGSIKAQNERLSDDVTKLLKISQDFIVENIELKHRIKKLEEITEEQGLKSEEQNLKIVGQTLVQEAQSLRIANLEKQIAKLLRL